MSVTSGFFNSLNSDRKYDALQLSSIFDGIINDGVYMSIGDKFIVSPKEGLTVIVGTGRAWFNHSWILNDADYLLTFDEPDLLNDRIDVIVLEFNNEIDIRENSIKIVKGETSTNPVAPTLIKNNTIKQYPIAHVRIAKEATEIVGSQIENKVGTSETPFVTGIIETINADELLAQWNSQWNEWKAKIEEDNTEWTTEQREAWQSWCNQQESDFNDWFNEYRIELNNYKTSFESDMETFKTDTQNDITQWIQSLKDLISDDVVANLLNTINSNAETDFKRYYSLINKETIVNKDQNGNVISIVETSNEAVCTTTFEEVDNVKIITTVIVPTNDLFDYTKTVTITNSVTSTGGIYTSISEVYTKTSK